MVERKAETEVITQAKVQKRQQQSWKKLCPACGVEADFLFHAQDRNRRVDDTSFRYFCCPKCRLVFLPEIPFDLGEFYGDDYYVPPSLGKIKKVARHEHYQLDMIRRFVSRGRLLEIGPGFGVFAYQAKEAGFEVDVIDREQRCCNYLRENIGVNAICSDSPQEILDRLEAYDVIALWQVLEHLPAPFEFLNKAIGKLKQGGVLLIATPSPDSFQFRLMKSQWPHVDAPRHVYLFPEALLNHYAGQRGMQRVYLTYVDTGALSWNRFGWQRFFMNFFRNKWFQRLAFVFGYAMSWLAMPWDRGYRQGSCYTVIYQKRSVSC